MPGPAWRLEQLFPGAVLAEVADSKDYEAPLHPEEAKLAARMAVNRSREFTAGRACARRALARLGITDVAVLSGPRREPRWPASVVGSIAHCAGFCAAVVARDAEFRGLGLDIEPVQRLEMPLAETVLSASEREALRHLPTRGAEWSLVAFVAKEAAFKALYPVLQREIGFNEMALDPTEWPAPRLSRTPVTAHELNGFLPRLEVRIALEHGHVLAGVSLPFR